MRFERVATDTLALMEVERMLAADTDHGGLLDRADLARGRPDCMRGSRCSARRVNAMLGATHRFCWACGTPVGALQRDEGRFRAGALFASRFRIVARLGRGGMGDVYRAARSGTRAASRAEVSRRVQLEPDATRRRRDSTSMRVRGCATRCAWRATRASQCLPRLRHRRGTRRVYLSMEYVDGEDLAALLKRIGRVPTDKGIEIARQLCAGLAAAHTKGVLHRDFKPSNIMIDGRGRRPPDGLRPGRFQPVPLEPRDAQRHAGVHGAGATGRGWRDGAERTCTRSASCSTSCSPASRRSHGKTSRAPRQRAETPRRRRRRSFPTSVQARERDPQMP